MTIQDKAALVDAGCHVVEVLMVIVAAAWGMRKNPNARHRKEK